MRRRTFVLSFLVAFAALCHTAPARWKPEYASASEETRRWYQTRTLTLEAQKRFGFRSCCGQADVVRTQFQVHKTTHNHEWWYQLRDGSFKKIPDDVIHWGQHAPDKRPTLFINSGGDEICFFPGDIDS